MTSPTAHSVRPESAVLRCLPPDAAGRQQLHDEVHARPAHQLQHPGVVLYLAVLNAEVAPQQEAEHLQRWAALSGPAGPAAGAAAQDASAATPSGFTRRQGPAGVLTWERHSEFSRWTWALPEAWQVLDEGLPPQVATWLAAVPGQTLLALRVRLVACALDEPERWIAATQQRLGGGEVAASLIGYGHSLAVTDFRIGPDGFESIDVYAPAHTTPSRIGRVVQRLLEVETYRMMALRGLPVAKDLAPMLARAEQQLAETTAQMGQHRPEQALLDALVPIAAEVERATAHHYYRFSATEAYAAIVRQRLTELREKPVQGTQTIGEFMQRRLSPAVATVASTAGRLSALSQRVERSSALLRTQVDIDTEAQNRQLLQQLTRGQALQLRLQTTVEGLSIAAISYYVIGLVLYAAKAAKQAGAPIQPEVLAGAMVPLALVGVWWLSHRIRARLHADVDGPEANGH